MINSLTPIIDNFSCSICLENDDEINLSTRAEMNCGHIFHESCLRKWINNHYTCPNCRADKNFFVDSKSQNFKKISQKNFQNALAHVVGSSFILMGIHSMLETSIFVNKYYESTYSEIFSFENRNILFTVQKDYFSYEFEQYNPEVFKTLTTFIIFFLIPLSTGISLIKSIKAQIINSKFPIKILSSK